MIQAKNIQKYFDDLHVLKGVDLHIKQGEIVSIVGVSAIRITVVSIFAPLVSTSIVRLRWSIFQIIESNIITHD